MLVGVQDFNLGSISNGADNNWSLPDVTSSFSGQSTGFMSGTSSYPSFTETLASFSPEETQSQNETYNSSSLLQQFQSESALRSNLSAVQANPTESDSQITNASNSASEQPDSNAESATRAADGQTYSTNAGVIRPETEQSRSDQAGSDQSGLNQSSSDQSDSYHSSTVGSDTNRPTETQSGVAKPGASQAGSSKSDAAKPDASKPDPSDETYTEGKTEQSAKAAQIASANQTVKEDTYIGKGEKSGVPVSLVHERSPDPSGVSKSMEAAAPANTKPKQGKAAMSAAKTAPGQTHPETGNAADPGATSAGNSVVPALAGLNTNVAAPAAPQADQETSASAAGSRNASKNKNPDGALAFAVKIGGSDAAATASSGQDDQPAPAATADTATASPFAAELDSMAAAFGEKGSAGREPESGIAGGNAALSTATMPQNASAALTDNTAAASQTKSAKPLDLPEEPATNTSAVKVVQVQINGSDNTRVDLRMMEKAGALTISVRSGDSSLTKALQQDLPELSNKLNDQQLRAEWWTPESQKASAVQKSENSPTGDSNSETPNQERQRGGNSGQQSGRDAQQPDWVDELTVQRKTNQKRSTIRMASVGSLFPVTSPRAVTPSTTQSTSSSSSSGSSATSSTSGSDSLANQNTFMQLLVAQLQYQDPTQPMDGTSFVTQLAQFSDLQQNVGTREDLDGISKQFLGSVPSETSSSSTSSGTTSTTGTSGT